MKMLLRWFLVILLNIYLYYSTSSYFSFVTLLNFVMYLLTLLKLLVCVQHTDQDGKMHLKIFCLASADSVLSTVLSDRMEMEADYIGLLLIASSGYDPRVAPKVYEKLGQIAGDSKLRDYLSTHPSGKKRAQLLAQAKVMEEALAIYREVKAGYGIEGFL